MNYVGTFVLPVLAALAGAVAAPAQSATTNNISVGGTAATISCEGCFGIVGGPGAGTLSETEASFYSTANGNPSSKFSVLQGLIASPSAIGDLLLTAPTQPAANQGTGGVDDATFSVGEGFFAIKLGGGNSQYAFFYASLAGLTNVSFDKNGYSSGGLSHTAQFGGELDLPPSVPLPATAPLLLGALALAAAVRRRPA